MYIPWDLIKHLLCINNNRICTPETLFRHHIYFNNNLVLQVRIGSMTKQCLDYNVKGFTRCPDQTCAPKLKRTCLSMRVAKTLRSLKQCACHGIFQKHYQLKLSSDVHVSQVSGYCMVPVYFRSFQFHIVLKIAVFLSSIDHSVYQFA